MIQLLSVPEGSNITIMNAMFIRGFKINVGGFDEDKIKTQDIMTVTYKDCDTGVKYKEEIVDPEVEFYVAKSDKRCPTNRLFIEEKDAYPVVCENRHLEKTIAEITGNKEFYYGNLNTGNFSENRKLHQHPDIFYSDVNIEDRTRALFGRLYKNEPCKVSKSFLDIETDIIDLDGRFAEPGECPINSVSLLLEEQRMIYVFLLRTKKNPQIVDFEKYVNGNTIGPDLLNFLTDSVGGQEMANKYSANNFSFKFLFFDEDKEIDLIASIFKVINHFKPDFTLAWNMGFDIPYIIERIRRLGYSPEEIMCHEDFRYKVAYYFVDEKKKSDFAERGDFANISSYTVYLDQMIQFASRRKAIRYPSYTLDSIGETIARVRKLDYKHITTDIAQLPYKDYKTFVFYNIMDVVVQYCIEFMTKDVDYVFTKCIVNNTRYSKIHRQTVYLTNRGEKIFRRDGFIMGNNCNKYNEKPTEKFAGVKAQYIR